jgi:N-acetylglutamate synthase-like GNAT family acetyltransferase
MFTRGVGDMDGSVMATTGPEVLIREAVADDQAAIVALVRQARINPTGLRWQRFLVAEEAGSIIGTGQIKMHRDGSRELASIAVIPERRRRGIAASLIRRLVALDAGPLFLICGEQLEPFYARFGFRRVADRGALPPYFKRLALISDLLQVAARVRLTGGMRFIVMERHGEESAA